MPLETVPLNGPQLRLPEVTGCLNMTSTAPLYFEPLVSKISAVRTMSPTADDVVGSAAKLTGVLGLLIEVKAMRPIESMDKMDFAYMTI